MKTHTILAMLIFLSVLAGSVGICVYAEENEEIEVKLSKRHKVTGLNSKFNFSKMTFKKYIKHMRKVIVKTRVDINEGNKRKILDANSPYEWRPEAPACPKNRNGEYQNGILMIHGLTDSPFMLHDIAKIFLKRCYLVRGILLPGHGTVPGDLLEVSHKEWLKATKYGIESLQSEVENISLCGFSTGGALSLYYAFKKVPIRALVLFSPAIKIRANIAFLSGWVNKFTWISDGMKWLNIKKDEDYAKYESFPVNAAAEVYELTEKVSEISGSKKVDIPMFIAISEDDTTISSEATIAFFEEQPNKNSRLILFSDRTTRYKDGRITIFPSKHDRFHVISQSHLSLTNDIGNKHYGINGDYRNCLHYNYEDEKYNTCKSGSSILWGENSEENIGKSTVARISFNPDFAYMRDRLNQFLRQVETQ